MVQWLRLCDPTAGSMALIPGQGTKISHAAGDGQKKNMLERLNEGTVLYSGIQLFGLKSHRPALTEALGFNRGYKFICCSPNSLSI